MNFCKICVRESIGPNGVDSCIPCTMNIVGHDIEKVDMRFDVDNIKMLQVPERGGLFNR